MKKPRRSIDVAAPSLGFGARTGGGDLASGAALALLDVEAGIHGGAGGGDDQGRRTNGYLSVPTPSESDRSRSTSPLYIGHNGFIFPGGGGGHSSGGTGCLSGKAAMMRFVSKTGKTQR